MQKTKYVLFFFILALSNVLSAQDKGTANFSLIYEKDDIDKISVSKAIRSALEDVGYTIVDSYGDCSFIIMLSTMEIDDPCTYNYTSAFSLSYTHNSTDERYSYAPRLLLAGDALTLQSGIIKLIRNTIAGI